MTKHRKDDVNESGDTTPEKEPNLSGLGDVGHPFDQTNDIVEGLEGDSDGWAEENTSDSDEPDDDGGVIPVLPFAPIVPPGR